MSTPPESYEHIDPEVHTQIRTGLGALIATGDTTKLVAAFQRAGVGKGKIDAMSRCFRNYERCVVDRSTGIVDNLDCAVDLTACVKRELLG
jgi:hypothetical protein